MIIHDKSSRVYFSTKIDDRIFYSGFGTKKTDFKKIFPSGYRHYQPTQTHSDIILSPDDIDKKVQGDGIYTEDRNIFLMVQTADCVPIIFVDQKRKAIGISHQGWRGTLKRLSQKMVREFVNHGSRVADITVAIGPAIGACCYDIKSDRSVEMKKEFPSHSQKIIFLNEGTEHLSLNYLNYLQLLDAGISKDQIDFFPFCTKCDDKQFFSYRRHDVRGQMTSFVTFRPQASS